MGAFDGNYECEGQMDIYDFISQEVEEKSQEVVNPKPNYKRKPLIYHMGLSAYYYECPYCKATNSVENSEEGAYCRCCSKYFEGEVERKTKELVECEKQLGPGGGAVYKDEKGKWQWSAIN